MDLNIRSDVRAFLLSEPMYFGYFQDGLADDLDLIASGAIDSIGIFGLVNFLENRFSIKVSPADLVDKNFANLLAIEEFVKALQK